MANRPQTGFTLVELLVSMAVAAILLGIGIPSFAGAIKDARLSEPLTKTRQALYLARSEAVKSSRVVTVCARATDTSCGADWDNGSLVFVADGVSAAGTVGAGQILRLDGPIDDRIDIVAFGSSTRAASGASARSIIHYYATGEADWENGSFVVCDDRGATHALGLNIALTGDIRSARTNDGDDTVLDVFGREVTC